MNHSFNVEIANETGVISAILLENIAHWIRRNRANGENFYDGDYWTYSSVSGWSELFPYMTKDQIRRGLEKLEKSGFVKTGNYNKSSYDRTKWYALTKKAWFFYGESVRSTPCSTENPCSENAKCTCHDCQMDLANLPNGSGENAKPIPDINKDIYIPPYSPPKGGVQNGAASSESGASPEGCLPDKQTKPETSRSSKEASGSSNGEKSVPPAAREILDYLNERTGCRYEPVKANLSLIEARLKEGFTPEKMMRVVDAKCDEWGNDEAMQKFLRPATLFGARNFAQYAGQLKENRYAHLPANRRPVRRPL